jgi:hypothetical protein
MTTAVLSLLALGTYFLSAFMLGRLLRGERSVVLNFGIGQAVLILLMILGGLFHILCPAYLVSVIIIPLIFAFLFQWGKKSVIFQEIRGSWQTFLGSFSPVEKVFILLLLVPPFLQCFTLILGAQEHDTLRYHWSIILQFLYAGRLVFCPEIFHGNGPLSLDMAFLPYLALGLENGARLHGWLFFVFLGAAAWRLGRIALGPKSALLSLLIWGTPLLSRFSTNGFIDVGLSYYGLLTLLLLKKWCRASSGLGGTALLGIAAGTMLGSKYTALFFLAGALVYVVYMIVFRKTDRSILDLAAVVLTVIATGGIWYMRNAVNLGNPVFPAAYNLFPSSIYSGDHLQSMHEWLGHRALPFGRNPASFLLFPWNFTMYSDRFQNWMSITPVYLATFPLLLRQAPRLFRLFALEATVLFVFFMIFFFTFHEARYLSPLMPLAALICVSAVFGSPGIPGSRCRAFWGVFILFNLAFSAVLAGRETVKTAPYFLKSARQIPAEKAPPFFSGYSAVNQRVKAGQKVLLIFGGGLHGSVHYYVKARSVMLNERYPEIIGLADLNPEALQDYLCENGFAYVLDMNPGRQRRLVPAPPQTLLTASGGREWALYAVHCPEKVQY